MAVSRRFADAIATQARGRVKRLIHSAPATRCSWSCCCPGAALTHALV